MSNSGVWDGDIATFPDYVRKVRLAFEKTRRRLVGQLTGRAWVITHERFTQPDGAGYLVEFLEEKLARVLVPDAGARAEELLVKLRRPQVCLWRPGVQRSESPIGSCSAP